MIYSHGAGTAWLTGTGALKSAILSKAGANELLSVMQNLNDGQYERHQVEVNMYVNGVYSNTIPSNFKTVKYDANGGQIAQGDGNTYTMRYDSSKEVDHIKATNGSEIFLGWYTADDEWMPKLTKDCAGKILYAHWQADYSGTTAPAANYTVTEKELVSTKAYTDPDTKAATLSAKASGTVQIDNDFKSDFTATLRSIALGNATPGNIGEHAGRGMSYADTGKAAIISILASVLQTADIAVLGIAGAAGLWMSGRDTLRMKTESLRSSSPAQRLRLAAKKPTSTMPKIISIWERMWRKSMGSMFCVSACKITAVALSAEVLRRKSAACGGISPRRGGRKPSAPGISGGCGRAVRSGEWKFQVPICQYKMCVPVQPKAEARASRAGIRCRAPCAGCSSRGCRRSSPRRLST